MSKFRKKPVVIEAEQFFPDKKPWPEGVETYHPKGDRWRVWTLEGTMNVKPGDWIITGVAGERYPCNPDIFEATYDAVKE